MSYRSHAEWDAAIAASNAEVRRVKLEWEAIKSQSHYMKKEGGLDSRCASDQPSIRLLQETNNSHQRRHGEAVQNHEQLKQRYQQ